MSLTTRRCFRPMIAIRTSCCALHAHPSGSRRHRSRQWALVGETGSIRVALALAVLGLLGEAEVYLHDAPDRSSDDKNLLDPEVAALYSGLHKG